MSTLCEYKEGTKLTVVANDCFSPHMLEGLIFSDMEDYLMFAQVGYARFTMISLKTGNRICEAIQMEVRSQGIKGVPERDVVSALCDELDDVECYTVLGTMKEVLGR